MWRIFSFLIFGFQFILAFDGLILNRKITLQILIHDLTAEHTEEKHWVRRENLLCYPSFVLLITGLYSNIILMLLLTDWQIAYKTYRTNGISSTAFVADEESAEYAAGSFSVNNLRALYREARITPAKTGLFVTLWKRSCQGPIEPYTVNDAFDLVVISVRNGDLYGQFIFSKPVLISKGIISSSFKEGKRGFRVYPPWSEARNKQAARTQKWQSEYFVDLTKNGQIDQTRLYQLFHNGK